MFYLGKYRPQTKKPHHKSGWSGKETLEQGHQGRASLTSRHRARAEALSLLEQRARGEHGTEGVGKGTGPDLVGGPN